jgi:hypothetical protein
MKIKKEYEFTHKRQLWRILPTNTGKIVIEERDAGLREVYFNCIEINKGKKIFDNLQLDEKFWIGIEGIYKDIIFFHKYLKPDMPSHKGIIAFDINSVSVLWENQELNFLFVSDNNIYCYKTLFKGKIFFTLNYLTGEIISELGNDPTEINKMKQNLPSETDGNEYIFPEYYDEAKWKALFKGLSEEFIAGNFIPGKIQVASYKDFIFFSALEQSAEGSRRNIFRAADILRSKIILSEEINRKTDKFLSDSFFLKGNHLFLLKEKDTLVVYSVK